MSQKTEKVDKELVGFAIEAGGAIVRGLIDAILSGDEARWRPLVDILPQQLKSRAVMIAEREKTRIELERLND